ncbi:MAG: hypothetical protein JKY49_09850 [Cohaesibacteraceae bacterium]|nr:hypothetical protein [Cohaesibacteraceae bacterium]
MNLIETARFNTLILLRFLTGDSNALEKLDASSKGFWGSFRAAFIVEPISYLIFIVAALTTDDETSPIKLFLIIIGVAVVNWIVVPLLYAGISNVLKFNDRYGRMIVTRNWTQIILLAIFLPAHLLSISEVFTPAMTGMSLLSALLMSFAVSTVLIKGALQSTWWVAFGLTLVDFLVGLVAKIQIQNLF